MSPGDRTIGLSLAYLWIALEMSLSNKRQKLDYYIEARELVTIACQIYSAIIGGVAASC